MDRQVCVIKPVANRARTDRHTHTHTRGQTEKKVKTLPKILSIDIFYFMNVIIGGPIKPLGPN